MHPPDNLSAFRIAITGDGASVDDAQIGGSVSVEMIGVFVTDTDQSLTHELRFVLIDFAAERDGF